MVCLRNISVDTLHKGDTEDDDDDDNNNNNNNNNLITIEFRVYEMMHMAKQANCVKYFAKNIIRKFTVNTPAYLLHILKCYSIYELMSFNFLVEFIYFLCSGNVKDFCVSL